MNRGPLQEEYGFIGNVWVRMNYLAEAGDTAGGHMHYHDHVSLLAKGSVEIQIGAEPAKTFVSPTFIVIKKHFAHKITALEDDTVFYCIYAMRDVDGEVVDIYQDWNLPNLPANYTPRYTHCAPDDFWEVPLTGSKIPIMVDHSKKD